MIATEVLAKGPKPRRRWLLRAALLLVLPALVVGLATIARWNAVYVTGLCLPGGDEVYLVTGSYLPSGGRCGSALTRWNWRSGKRWQITEDNPFGSGIVVSPDRRWLAIGQSRPAMTFYDAQSLEPLGTVELAPPEAAGYAAYPIAVSANGRFLLIGSSGGTWIVESATLRLTTATFRLLGFADPPDDRRYRANSWSHQVLEYAGEPATPPSAWQVLEFEEGRLTRIAEGPCSGYIRLSHDRSYAYDGCQVSDLCAGTSRVLVLCQQSSYWRFVCDFAPAEQQIAIANELGVHLVDCPTGEVVRRYDCQGEQPTEVVFSWDGRQLAALTDEGSLFVWDVASGGLLASDRPHRRFLVFTAMVTAATIAWCVIWFWLGLQERSAWWTVANLAVLAGLAVFGFFGRQINDWDPATLVRIPAVASRVVLLATAALLGVGLVFGRSRWLTRFSAVLAAFAMLWAWPTVIWGQHKLEQDGGLVDVPSGAVMVAALVAGLLSLVRWRGWRVAEPDAAASRPPARMQFTLRDLLWLTAAVAVTLLLAQQMQLPREFDEFRQLRWLETVWVGLMCLTQVLVAVAAFWAALSQRPFWQRVTMGLAAAAVVAAAVPLAFQAFNVHLPFWGWFRGHMLAGLYVFAALMLFRLRGYRLVRAAVPV